MLSAICELFLAECNREMVFDLRSPPLCRLGSKTSFSLPRRSALALVRQDCCVPVHSYFLLNDRWMLMCKFFDTLVTGDAKSALPGIVECIKPHPIHDVRKTKFTIWVCKSE